MPEMGAVSSAEVPARLQGANCCEIGWLSAGPRPRPSLSDWAQGSATEYSKYYSSLN